MVSLALLGSAAAQQDDPLPPRWMEDVSALDGSVQTSWVFRSTAGVGYRVEFSRDLQDWEEIGNIYGLGHEHVVPLVERAPAPPPDPEAPGGEAVEVPSQHVSLMVAPAASPETGTILSWRSLDSGGSVVFRIPESLHQDWSEMPWFAHPYGDYYFFVLHLPTPQIPPQEESPLAEEDAAMVNEFRARLPEMNAAVANSVAVARAAPPPAPASPDGRGFVRISADWSLDSDSDGSPDWAEFAVMLDPEHPDSGLASPFQSDNDGDGVPDGQQLDSDGDSVPDSEDAVANDSLINWKKTPHSVYAVFELPISSLTTPGLWPEGPAGVDDVGRVMFSRKVWDRGEIVDYGEDALLYAMNDQGWVVGSQTFDDDLNESRESRRLVWWKKPGDGASEMRSGNDAARAPYDMAHGFLRFGSTLSNDGKIVVQNYKGVSSGSGSGVSWQQDQRVVWDLEPEGSEPVYTPAPPYAVFAHESGALWGYDWQNEEGFLTGAGGAAISLGKNEFRKMVEVGGENGNGGLVLLGEKVTPRARKSSSDWSPISKMKDLIDLSKDGTGVMREGLVWRNGRLYYLPEIAPGLDGEWKQARLLGMAGSGSLVAGLSSHEAPADFTRLLSAVPVRVEDDEFATGVDPVSATALKEDERQGGKIWVMVPGGGSEANASVVHAPVTPDRALTLSAGNVAITPATLDLGTTPVSWSSAATSSSEVDVDLGFEDADSVSHPIGVKVMKRREVKLHFWHVAQNNGVDGRVNPEHAFTKAEIEEFLDDIYGKQVNAYWDVETSGDVQPTPVYWDYGTGEDFQQEPGSGPASGNGSLDSNGSDIGTEQSKILTSAGVDAAADINVYFVGGAEQITVWRDFNSEFHGFGGYVGLAHPASRTVWLPGNTGRSKSGILNTLAHEIGHVMMGGGHPNDGGGPAPLAGTHHPDRLMYSNPFHTGLLRKRLLVKGEWDKIDEWLTEFID